MRSIRRTGLNSSVLGGLAFPPQQLSVNRTRAAKQFDSADLSDVTFWGR